MNASQHLGRFHEVRPCLWSAHLCPLTRATCCPRCHAPTLSAPHAHVNASAPVQAWKSRQHLQRDRACCAASPSCNHRHQNDRAAAHARYSAPRRACLRDPASLSSPPTRASHARSRRGCTPSSDARLAPGTHPPTPALLIYLRAAFAGYPLSTWRPTAAPRPPAPRSPAPSSPAPPAVAFWREG